MAHNSPNLKPYTSPPDEVRAESVVQPNHAQSRSLEENISSCCMDGPRITFASHDRSGYLNGHMDCSLSQPNDIDAMYSVHFGQQGLEPVFPQPNTFDTSIQIAHLTGQNDLMTGALCTGFFGETAAEDDELDCDSDLWKQLEHMKWRVLFVEELLSVPGLFHDPETCVEQLGWEFLTTNEGLRRAIEECQDAAHWTPVSDTMVIGALAKRGGILHGQSARLCVFYPEDMLPIIGEEFEQYDEEYWTELYSQGQTWYEMPV